MNKEISSRLAERREHRRAIRISSIARYLQDKLSQFPNNPLERESFLEGLRHDAQKLYAEPNGKELLFCLGNIYISKAQASRNKFSITSILSTLQKYCDPTSPINKALLISTAGCFFGFSGPFFTITLALEYFDILFVKDLISRYLEIKTKSNPSQEEVK